MGEAWPDSQARVPCKQPPLVCTWHLPQEPWVTGFTSALRALLLLPRRLKAGIDYGPARLALNALSARGTYFGRVRRAGWLAGSEKQG